MTTGIIFNLFFEASSIQWHIEKSENGRIGGNQNWGQRKSHQGWWLQGYVGNSVQKGRTEIKPKISRRTKNHFDKKKNSGEDLTFRSSGFAYILNSISSANSGLTK